MVRLLPQACGWSVVSLGLSQQLLRAGRSSRPSLCLLRAGWLSAFSLAWGPRKNLLRSIVNVKSKVSDLSREWPEGSLFNSYHTGIGEGATPFTGLLHFTLDPYLIMLSVKQGGIKYHFLSLWYDSTWDWTPVSRAETKPERLEQILHLDLLCPGRTGHLERQFPIMTEFRLLITCWNSVATAA